MEFTQNANNSITDYDHGSKPKFSNSDIYEAKV